LLTDKKLIIECYNIRIKRQFKEREPWHTNTEKKHQKDFYVQNTGASSLALIFAKKELKAI